MSEQSARLRVASFNLRFGTAEDGENAWPYRRPVLFRAVAAMDPDLMGTQEGLSFQLEELDSRFSGLGRFGLGRYHGVYVDRPHEAYSGEHCALFYRRPRFEVIESRTRWLSETPEVSGSLGWGAHLARVVTYGRLRDTSSGKEVAVLNTHLHWGRNVTAPSVRVLQGLLAEIPTGLPVVVIGDFNLEPTSPERSELTTFELSGGRHLSDAFPVGTGGTCHDFDGVPKTHIDWILVSTDIAVRHAEIVQYHENGRYPSDHFPVFADLELPNSG